MSSAHSVPNRKKKKKKRVNGTVSSWTSSIAWLPLLPQPTCFLTCLDTVLLAPVTSHKILPLTKVKFREEILVAREFRCIQIHASLPIRKSITSQTVSSIRI